MLKYLYKFAVLILLLIVGGALLNFYKVNQYAMALEGGEKLSCSDFQKGMTKYKGACWSCPTGYENWINKSVSNPESQKHCRKPNQYIDAIYHSKPTGLLKLKCESKEVWFKNKACWTCPSDYKPARIKEEKGTAQCKPENKYTYRPALKTGDLGCPSGSWAGALSKRCYRCPKGFSRNMLTTALDHDPSDDPKACKGQVSLMEQIFKG